jgi:hypothetical protein
MSTGTKFFSDFPSLMACLNALIASSDVKQGILHSVASLLILNPSELASLPIVGVFKTISILP